MTEAPFVVEKCVLLALRPKLFLPERRPLLINTRRVLREPGGPPLSDSDAASWTQYFPHPNNLHLIDASDQEFEEFDFVSNRSQEQSLSIFSLLVNANSKLQAADNRNDYPPGTRSYIANVKEAIRAIFFVPPQIHKQTPSQTPVVPSIPSGQQSDVSGPRRSTRSRGGRGDSEKTGGQGPSNIDSGDGGLVDEGHPDLYADFEGSDNYSEEDDEGGHEEYEEEYDEEDEEPNMINGLTFPEMETVLQRVSDGNISADERADAAMLMLGMAGGLSLSISSLSLSDSSTRPQTSAGSFSIDPGLHVSGEGAPDPAPAFGGLHCRWNGCL